MYFADLHVHTTVSDCSEDVSVILNMAKETGITHIAFYRSRYDKDGAGTYIQGRSDGNQRDFRRRDVRV